MHDAAMAEMFERVVYHGPAGKESWCQVGKGTTSLPENKSAEV